MNYETHLRWLVIEWLTGQRDLYPGYARLKSSYHTMVVQQVYHIFIIVIVSCISTIVAISNLSIIVSIGTEVYSSLLKFKRLNT